MERTPAVKCTIADILNGRYVEKSGEPNYLETNRGKVLRANVIGVVIDRQPQALLLDDATGRLEVKSFEPVFAKFTLGEILLVIGRVRAHEGNTYLVAEIAKKLSNEKWLEVRRRELVINSPNIKKVEKPPATQPPEPVPDTLSLTAAEKMLQLIRVKDTGSGAAVEEIADDSETEQTLERLMAEGEVFEIRPGKVKVLE